MTLARCLRELPIGLLAKVLIKGASVADGGGITAVMPLKFATILNLITTLKWLTMNTVSLLLQDSGTVEYYTDPRIIEAARRVMGGIDLDPASSQLANCTVKARMFFSLQDDAVVPTLSRNWGTVEKPNRLWMNHPFGRREKTCKSNCQKKKCKERGYHITQDVPGNQDWVEKLVAEYEAGRLSQACCITFAATSEAWFQPLYQGCMCFLSPRTNYYLPNGKKKKGVTKGSVVTYFGPRERHEVFRHEFAQFGKFPNA